LKPEVRQKLTQDAINKTWSNLFDLRGQFAPVSKPIKFEGFENLLN